MSSFWGLLGLGSLYAGGSILSGLMGSASSDYAAKKGYDAQMATNELNYQIFKENMAWQERMANTAHQREVQDLRSAGLNPILSATGGSGAAVPNVASPSMVSPGSSVADKSAVYQAMIDSALRSTNTAADVIKKLEETDQISKVTKTEVGKRNLIGYLHNTITDNAGNITSAGRQVIDIVKELSHAAANNFNVMKKTLFQDFRQMNKTQINNAREIPGMNLE